MPYEAKRFYRNLDELLHEIDLGRPGTKRYHRIVHRIVERFGDELNIADGRLYVEVPGGFRLDRALNPRADNVEGLLVPRGYRPLELVLEHGSYIFDRSVEGQSEELEEMLGGEESVAILVDDTPRRIIAFGLTEGWDRERLAFSMNVIRNAINHRLEIEKLSSHLEDAAEIQRSLLPESPPEWPGFSIAVRMRNYSTAGGDFYDFLTADAGLMGLAIGDAAGHSVGSALLARDVVTGLRMAYERDLKLTAIVTRLNRVLARNSLTSRFVSLFLAELESNGTIFYVNAGHPPPVIFGARGPRPLHIGGTILGPLEDAIFRRGFAHVDRGDTMVLFTDGLIERENAAGEAFGEARLAAVVEPLAGRPADVVADAVIDEAESFGGGTPWRDDVTLLVVTRAAA